MTNKDGRSLDRNMEALKSGPAEKLLTELIHNGGYINRMQEKILKHRNPKYNALKIWRFLSVTWYLWVE